MAPSQIFIPPDYCCMTTFCQLKDFQAVGSLYLSVCTLILFVIPPVDCLSFLKQIFVLSCCIFVCYLSFCMYNCTNQLFVITIDNFHAARFIEVPCYLLLGYLNGSLYTAVATTRGELFDWRSVFIVFVLESFLRKGERLVLNRLALLCYLSVIYIRSTLAEVEAETCLCILPECTTVIRTVQIHDKDTK